MLDYRGVFHVGVRVLDLEQSMRSVGEALEVSWAPVVEREVRCWTPTGGPAVAQLRFTYTGQGPQRVELIEGSVGSVWDATDATGPGLHHLGVWVDSVAEATEDALAVGWTLVACGEAPDEGYGGFSYVRSPEGFIVEPVDRIRKAPMEAWWAGEDRY